jgi:hypothetical protein
MSFFSRLTSTVTSAISEAVAKVQEVTQEFSLDSLQVRVRQQLICAIEVRRALKNDLAGGIWRSYWAEADV